MIYFWQVGNAAMLYWAWFILLHFFRIFHRYIYIYIYIYIMHAYCSYFKLLYIVLWPRHDNKWSLLWLITIHCLSFLQIMNSHCSLMLMLLYMKNMMLLQVIVWRLNAHANVIQSCASCLLALCCCACLPMVILK